MTGARPHPLAGDAISVQEGQGPAEHIKADTLEGIADGISERLKAVSQITKGFSLGENFPKNLKETVKTFNGYAKSDKDLDFRRGESTYDREWTTGPPYVLDVE